MADNDPRNLTPIRHLLDQEKRALNKIFRAVHDLVCPICGSNMSFYSGAVNVTICRDCDFRVTGEEMEAMSLTMTEWGLEPLRVFQRWRNGEI